ncbi:MAG: TatD family hydrolase [Saprospiraceae bacterium]|nr:TatD family hydrolase [Saprospiraceae bacterium]
MFIDTHAHIYLPQFDDDRDETLNRARKAGVEKILMPNIDLTSVESLHRVEQRYPAMCHSMMGLHPCSVDKHFAEHLDGILAHLDSRDYIAVGEIGLDLYWDKTYLEEQIEAFKLQTQWAHKRGLPIVIHSRESTKELLQILEGLALPGLRGVFHCFSGNADEGKRIVDLGFFLGIGGVVTFKNGGLDQVLPEISLEHLILETDAPYLAPHPYRGKRNESAYIPLIAEKLSAIYDGSIELIAEQTSKNAQTLFGPLMPPKDTNTAS